MDELDIDEMVGSAATVHVAAPRVGFFARLARGEGSAFISLLIALTVHAAVIAAGVFYYRTFIVDKPPRLLIPQGTATELAGSGQSASKLAEVMIPSDLSPPGQSEAANPPDLLSPPRDFTPSEVTPPPVVLDPSSGTADYAPLPTFAADRSPPVTGPHFPPGYHPDADAAPGASPPSSSDNHSASSAGQDSGGAQQGIPDGLPIPSLHNDQPIYPEVALRKGWEGVVYLELDVDPTGRVANVRVLKSSGYEALDDNAVAKLKTWSFTPATLNGQPLASSVKIPVNFTLPRRHR